MEETDISELEKRYWVLKAQSKTGRFDQETFKSFVCPPMPETLCEGKKYMYCQNFMCSVISKGLGAESEFPLQKVVHTIYRDF